MKLPIHTQQGGITTEAPGNIRNPENYGASYRSVAQGAQNVLSLAEQWQKSKDEVENLDGKNKLFSQMTEILNEADDYREYNNFADLQNLFYHLTQTKYVIRAVNVM